MSLNKERYSKLQVKLEEGEQQQEAHTLTGGEARLNGVGYPETLAKAKILAEFIEKSTEKETKTRNEAKRRAQKDKVDKADKADVGSSYAAVGKGKGKGKGGKSKEKAKTKIPLTKEEWGLLDSDIEGQGPLERGYSGCKECNGPHWNWEHGTKGNTKSRSDQPGGGANKPATTTKKGTNRSTVSAESDAPSAREVKLQEEIDILKAAFRSLPPTPSIRPDGTARSMVERPVSDILSPNRQQELRDRGYSLVWGVGRMMVSRLAASVEFNRDTILLDPCANNHDIVNPRLARNIRPNPVKGCFIDTAAGLYEMSEVCDVPILGKGGWNPRGTLNVLCAGKLSRNPRLRIKWH